MWQTIWPCFSILCPFNFFILSIRGRSKMTPALTYKIRKKTIPPPGQEGRVFFAYLPTPMSAPASPFGLPPFPPVNPCQHVSFWLTSLCWPPVSMSSFGIAPKSAVLAFGLPPIPAKVMTSFLNVL